MKLRSFAGALVCAVALGWQVGPVEFSREPLVRNGTVVGIRELASSVDVVERELSLELVFELDGEDEDLIEITGEPGCVVRVEGGLHGDAATVACTLHAAKVVSSLVPGLRLPIEASPWVGPS